MKYNTNQVFGSGGEFSNPISMGSSSAEESQNYSKM